MAIETAERMVLLISKPTDMTDLEDLRIRLAHHRSHLEHRFGANATLRLAIRHPQDQISQLSAETHRFLPVDGAIEITWPAQTPFDQIMTMSIGLGDVLADCVDPQRSDLLAGTAYMISSGDGPIFAALAARRDPRISVQEMRRWWLHHHAELVKRIVRPLPKSYEQLHIDRELSERLSKAAGLNYEPYDLFDTINLDNVEGFSQVMGNPEIAQQLYQDEMGYVDHSSGKGAVCGVIEQPGH